MNILFLSGWFPRPPINGAKIRINNLLRYLAQKHDVTLIAKVNTLPPDQVQDRIAALEREMRKVIAIPAAHATTRYSVRDLFARIPRSITATYDPALLQVIDDEIANSRFDLLIASEVGGGTGVAYYASKAQFPLKVLDCLEIGTHIDRLQPTYSIQSRIRSGLTWIKTKPYLRDILRTYQACTVPSDVEHQYISRFAPPNTRLEIIPHGVDLEHLHTTQNDPEPNTIVYNGALTYFPNLDAVQVLLSDILPRIKVEAPNVVFRVLGDTGPLDLSPWQRAGEIEFLGRLMDVRPEIWRANVNLVPLRHGSGTRLKILEAMALGTPVVSTTKGAEGLEVTPEENILIADDPAEFAAQTVRLLRHPALRARLAENGRKLVESKYDWRIVGERFNRLVESVAAARTPA